MPPAGYEAKLARADEHILTLEHASKSFIRQHQPRVVQEFDARINRQAFFVRDLTEPPPRLSVIAGEVVHQLRSSLDHLVHRLIIAHTHRRPRGRNYGFPIYEDRDEYFRNGVRKIREVSDSAREIIQELQPFNYPEITPPPLSLLGRMNNEDKHRLLNVVFITGHLESMEIESSEMIGIWGGGGYNDVVAEGTMLAAIDDRIGPNVRMQPHVKFGLGVRINPARVVPLGPVMRLLRRTTAQVFQRLADELP